MGPLVQAIYSGPEVAWVGERSENRCGGESQKRWLYETLLHEGPAPWIVLYSDSGGRLYGGEAVGIGAAALMSALGLAIAGGLTLASLQLLQAASPTVLEGLVEGVRNGGRIP